MAEGYLSFFIKCTVVQFNFLHLERNISEFINIINMYKLYPSVLCLFNVFCLEDN